MKYSPLTVSRSRVLGTLYTRCERMSAKSISVYLNDSSGEKLGVADESQGQYADAFTFHLSEENCKMLAGGKYDYSFDYYFSGRDAVPPRHSKRRIKLISIFLTPRKTVEKPVAPIEPTTDNYYE